MWTPKKGSTYRYLEEELTVEEVPKTAGIATYKAENKIVECVDGDGNKRINPIVWWTKRKEDIEVVK